MGFFTDGIASSSSTTIVFEVISGMLEKNPGLRLVADLTYCNLSEFLLVDQLVLHLSVRWRIHFYSLSVQWRPQVCLPDSIPARVIL